mmetsp:Transcript_24633/g.28148  ORF Transcript_24633/g.28148 Transcript_24633/m.28148 type:complete len:88 (+) Transcript_24633:447-710(+)
MMDCLVTQEDFDKAINDIRESMGSHDHTEEDSASSDNNNLSTSSSSSTSNNNNDNDTTSSDDLLDGNHVNGVNGVIIDDIVKDGSII